MIDGRLDRKSRRRGESLRMCRPPGSSARDLFQPMGDPAVLSLSVHLVRSSMARASAPSTHHPPPAPGSLLCSYVHGRMGLHCPLDTHPLPLFPLPSTYATCILYSIKTVPGTSSLAFRVVDMDSSGITDVQSIESSTKIMRIEQILYQRCKSQNCAIALLRRCAG